MGETQPAMKAVAPAVSNGWAWSRIGSWPRRLGMLAAAVVLWPLVMTVVYAVVPPPVTNVMITRWITGNPMRRDWVKLDEISPNLQRAVVSSEDARFCEHHGVDWIEFLCSGDRALHEP